MPDRLGVRGSPLLQLVLVTVAFVLAGLPVWRLTHPAAAVVAPTAALPSAESSTAQPTSLEVEALFAPAPADFQIKSLDATVLDGHGPQARFTRGWTAAVPTEGVDLVVQAHWPAAASGDATPAAARVTVLFPDGRQVEKSFWAAANGSLAEVFTVPGASPTP